MRLIWYSVIYSMQDLAYLFRTPIPLGRKWRVFFVYFKMVLLFILSSVFRFRKTSTKAFGIRFYFEDFKTFAFIFREVFVKHEYLPKNNPKVIFDCGANIGITTLFLKERFPRAKIHCFEPLPTNFNLLKKNVEVNGLKDVIIYQYAVSERDCKIPFFFNEEHATSGTSSRWKGRGGSTKIVVEGKRLSNLVKKHKPDLLKIDIEGGEFPVFADMAKTGALKIIKEIVVEYHHNMVNDAQLSKFLKFIEDAGFKYNIDSTLAPRSGFQDMLIYAYR